MSDQPNRRRRRRKRKRQPFEKKHPLLSAIGVAITVFAAMPVSESLLYPAPDIDKAVHARYPHQIALTIHAGKDGVHNRRPLALHEKDFILLPSVFYDPKVLLVTQRFSGRMVFDDSGLGDVYVLFGGAIVAFVGIYVQNRRKQFDDA